MPIGELSMDNHYIPIDSVISYLPSISSIIFCTLYIHQKGNFAYISISLILFQKIIQIEESILECNLNFKYLKNKLNIYHTLKKLPNFANLAKFKIFRQNFIFFAKINNFRQILYCPPYKFTKPCQIGQKCRT